MKNYTTNELIALSNGEYSDYCIRGLFKVLKAFDADALLIEWAKETGRDLVDGIVQSDYKTRNVDFIGWLNKNGYIEDVDYRELHTGCYGETRLTACK